MQLFSWTEAMQYIPSLLQGLRITVELTLIVIALSGICGVFVALGRLSRYVPIRIFVSAYVEFIRATPLLLQLIYIYFVLPFMGIKLNAFLAGVAGLSVNYTAYLSEVYRGGLQAIPKGQIEAAQALGIPSATIVFRVVLPQTFRIVLPSLGNYFVSLFKDTSLVSALSLQELLYSGQVIASETFQYFTVYTVIFALYFAVSYPSSLFVRYLEHLTRRGYARKKRPARHSVDRGLTAR